eukprot:gene28099-33931_t
MPRRKPRSRSQGDFDERDVVFLKSRNEMKKLSLADRLDSPLETALVEEATTTSDGKRQLDLFYGKRDYGGEGIYEGTFLNGLRHGQGSMKTRAGHRLFEGTWRCDQRLGYGLSLFKGGNRHEGLYAADRMHGRGVFVWTNGDKYSGHFEQGNIHGYGRFEWANGDVYTGNWNKGVIDGEGCMRKFDGQVLEGRFCRGQIWGWAKKRFSDGDTYEGYMQGNQHIHWGEYAWCAGGGSYRGQWKKGVIQGVGEFDNSNKAHPLCPHVTEPYRYKGQFKNGKPVGYGQYDYVELGTRSLGTWDEAGKGWAEMWSKAEESEAAQSGPAGLVYEGETQDHLRHGQGQLTFVGESAEQEEGLGQLDVSKLGEEGWTLEEVLEKWGGRALHLRWITGKS